jgi:papilin
LPKESGECGEKHARWHFSQSDNKCMPFYYTGCGENANNYDSERECETSCPPEVGEDKCAELS